LDKSHAVYELNQVTYHYPHEEPVLCDINITVHPGEKLCVLGANGCGKSTLLKLLTGLLFPVQGNMKFYGDEVVEKSLRKEAFARQFRRKVGFIFQNSEVQLFCSTVQEEIAFGPLQLGFSQEEAGKRVTDVLELLGIGHLREKTPFKLSGGEKKKVAIGSVLALNPEVLILDEPTNGLDPRTQRWLVELLISLNKAGKTIITSTHNLELVQEISDRSLVFSEEHRIVLDASTREVMENIELLKGVNLVDEYYHRHGDQRHAHSHIHNY
jgi:cobalt/nickel transport system ATP-binding protein